MIFGDLGGLKLPDICLAGEENPEKPHPGNLPRPEIEPGPPAWQARMLPPSPQQWTNALRSKVLNTQPCQIGPSLAQQYRTTSSKLSRIYQYHITTLSAQFQMDTYCTFTALYWLRISSQTMGSYYKIVIFHPLLRFLHFCAIFSITLFLGNERLHKLNYRSFNLVDSTVNEKISLAKRYSTCNK